jgi:predicted nuclease of predicted toxin-antitoxin system
MKFKLDEHLPVELAESLVKAGFDAVTVLAQDLGGSPDADLVSACRTEGRVLITLDLGFADIRSYPPETSPGIIVLRLGRQDKPHVLAVGAQLPDLLRTEPVDKRLWIVEEHRLRIRE